MRKVFEKFIRQCNEDFVEEYPMDAVDVCILDNFVLSISPPNKKIKAKIIKNCEK